MTNLTDFRQAFLAASDADSAIKPPVRLAATVNITPIGIGQTIDGAVTQLGDRVLLTAQTDGRQNGIRIVSDGIWPVPADFSNLVSGTLFTVTAGVANAGQYSLTTANPIILGTSALTFVTSVVGGLAAETAARIAADNTLQANINAEASTRTTNDNAEAATRAAADTTLQTNITAEATARAAADTTITANLVASSGSSLVGFLANGIGAIQDTLQNELRLRGPTPQNFGATGLGAPNDDSAAFVLWLSAINGKVGYIPEPSVAYYLPNGISITGHSFTTINSDAFSKLDCTAMVSGFAVTIDSSQFCDLNFGSINCGFSGIKVSRTTSNSDYNKIGYQRLQGSGKQVTKPTDPLANRVGISFVGPILGQENYFHTVKSGGKIDSFDTNIAFSGNANANGIVVHAQVLSGCWFGVYHNAADNQVLDAMWGGAIGTDGSHLAECVRYGDGSTAAAWNVTTGIAEPGGANCTVGLAQANAIRNLTIVRDNLDTPYTDNGTNNRWITSLTDVFNGGEYPIITRGTFTPTIGDGTHNCTTSIAAGFWERRTTSGGSMLSFTIALVTTAKTSVVGTILIGGLPVASNATTNRLGNHVIGQYGGITFDAGYTQISAYQNPGSTFVRLSEGGSGKTAQDLVDTNIAAATTINLTGHYFI